MILFAQQKERHKCRKQTWIPRQGRGVDWETETDVYKLLILSVRQVTNASLLYPSGTSTQCSVMGRMGRKSKKRGSTGIHIADSPCSTVEMNATLHSKCIPMQIN